MCVFDSFVHTKNKIKPNSLNSNNKSEKDVQSIRHTNHNM